MSRLASCGAGVVDVPPIQTIKCLLIVPNPESALDEEAGKLLLEDYQEYYKVCIQGALSGDSNAYTPVAAQRAKLMTSIHATPKVSSTPVVRLLLGEYRHSTNGPSAGQLS